MKSTPWLAGLLVGTMTLLVVSVCGGRGQASEYAEAAETAKDSMAVLMDGIRVAEDSVARMTTLAMTHDTVLVETVISTTLTIEVARGAAALADSSFTTGADSLRAMLDTTGVRILDRMLEDRIVGQRADAIAFQALEVRLTETEANRLLWRSLSFQKDTLLLGKDGVIEQAVLRGDEFEAAYNREKSSARKTKVAAVIVTVCAMICPRLVG